MNLQPNASDALKSVHLQDKKYVTYVRVSTPGANDAPTQKVPPTVAEQLACVEEVRSSFRYAGFKPIRRHKLPKPTR